MSRLTSSPFHKPSPFQFPHVLPSPPETQAESITMTPALPPSVAAGVHDHGINEFTLGTSFTPDQSSRIRRSSSIAYNTSSLREPKERPIQRPSKPLVIIIPPPGLIPAYAQTSSAFSMGPPSRMLQGTIMPLLPSMFAQLTAIAKEFNFPSTTGLCLYMHYVEDGISMIPRVSEDSWHSLWTHFSEPALLPHERKALVAGKLEFDIDLRHARWYNAWISNVLREVPDPLSHHLPSAAPSLAHYRGESKTTFTEGRHLDDDIPETSSPRPLHSVSAGRHVPRKLSLVERFDVAGPKPESRLAAPAMDSSNPQVLSPIEQEDEPQSARHDLDTRVNSWRATALTTTHKLAAKGQPSLDPPNLPNDIPIQSPSLPVEEEVELNLADYAWSVSSFGPASTGELSPLSWSRVSSVDLANRVIGSVCTTPSICTSFGPADYESLTSPVSWGRVSSVHLGDRMVGSVASTPSICTSFGPADYDPLSPLVTYSRVPSPDIAHRLYDSAPPTPFTATSWGAPSSYPPSPACYSSVSSVGLPERLSVEGHHLPHYSSDEEEEGEIKLFNPWPFTDRLSSTEDSQSFMQATQEGTSTAVSEQRSGLWRHAWPYTAVRTPTPVQEEDPSSLKDASFSSVPEGASLVKPWGQAWPYNAASHLDIDQQPSTPPLQRNVPWGHAWPYNRTVDVDVTDKPLDFVYPYFRIYAPVYPVLEIYPPRMTDNKLVEKERFTLSTDLPSCYPCIEIYKPGYPHNLDNVYPHVKLDEQLTRSHRVDYPYFDLYPAVSGPRYGYLSSLVRAPSVSYPNMDIYPVPQSKSLKKPPKVPATSSSQTATNYPIFNLYPAVYPFFDLYPALSSGYQRIAPSVNRPSRTVEKINLHIYPPVRPAVYPEFDIYPAVMAPLWHADESPSPSLNPSKHVYPYFDIYPAVYPQFNIYPPAAAEGRQADVNNDLSTMPRTSQAVAPDPAVYPHFDLYPSNITAVSTPVNAPAKETTLTTSPQAIYPVFNLYPAVYPYMDLYLPLPEPYPPPKSPKCTTGNCSASATSRLTHSELHAMVMMERAGYAGGFHSPQSSIDEVLLPSMSQPLNRSPSSIRQSKITHLPSNPRELRRPSMAFNTPNSSLVSESINSAEHPMPLRKSLSLRHRDSPQSSDTVPVRPLAQRRDSLVSQRVKAYAANGEDLSSFSSCAAQLLIPL
ncbi:hypothetical protein CVT24_004046 [Panaeolus cyanescens]|uniref:Uncharacterized protein n=1 Tax=Panaeolus cyanescens TaxID=181874 RepID=A0A409Y677_9AGAR|nr:hypothetical protein CVT24_004046 [Panaeolus cyanescens]